MPDLTIPQNDMPFLSWASGFHKVLAKHPARYGVSAADVQVIAETVNQYRVALDVIRHEGTRTKVTVAEKNVAKTSLMQLMRRYVALIQPNAGVSDADKIALGLHIRSRAYQRREVPASSPLLSYVGSTPLRNIFAVRDSFTPEVRRKPFGASGVQLFAALGDGPEHDVSNARYVGEFTRFRFAVDHEPAEAGRVASYFARWIGHRKDVGPWSLPVHAIVPWPSSDSAMPDAGSDKPEAAGESLHLAA